MSQTLNCIYLLLHRPIFITGFIMWFLPILVNSDITRPLRNFLGHNFWIPFSRLSFGAYLSHGVFIQFREFNVERGQWACNFDAVLMYLAYLTFAFIFSLGLNFCVEMPINQIWEDFAGAYMKYVVVLA
jgi:peptidoglycan/LPS O-acetylase OafA/YrhL